MTNENLSAIAAPSPSAVGRSLWRRPKLWSVGDLAKAECRMTAVFPRRAGIPRSRLARAAPWQAVFRVPYSLFLLLLLFCFCSRLPLGPSPAAGYGLPPSDKRTAIPPSKVITPHIKTSHSWAKCSWRGGLAYDNYIAGSVRAGERKRP